MSLIEILLVVAIVSVLSQLVNHEFRQSLMRAKRTEARLGLNALWKAQREYLGRHETYAGTFDVLDFGVVGGRQLAPNVYKGVRYTYQLAQPWGDRSFYCIATAQLDSDPWPDILEIFEKDPQAQEGSQP